MCKIIKEICMDECLAFIHAITPNGGACKSIHNNEKIDIYDRFNFNIRDRKGIAASVIKNSMQPSKTFGTQGLIIFDGKVNNVNSSDAGSQFNDSHGLWETPEGIQFPIAIEVQMKLKWLQILMSKLIFSIIAFVVFS